MRVPVVVVVGCLLAACAAQKRTSQAAAPSVSSAPCTVPVRAADSLQWKQVQADRFSFCVPAGWRQSGDRWWSGDGARIAWGDDEQIPIGVIGEPQAPSGLQAPEPAPRHFIEQIGDELAELWDRRVSDANYTQATWPGKRLFFRGRASTLRKADVQLAIYRTVRFSEAAPAGSTPPQNPPQR